MGGASPAQATTTPIGSMIELCPHERGPVWPAAATYTVFSIARALSRVAQWSSLPAPTAHAAGRATSCAPASTTQRKASGKRRS